MWALPYSSLRRLTAGAVRQGLSFESLMSESLIDLKYGDDRDVIGPAQLMLLCMKTVLRLDDAAHGLANASIMPCHSELSLRVALSAATLEGAINAVGRLHEKVSTAVRLKLRPEHDLVTLSISVDAPNEEDAFQLEEIYLSWLFMHCMYFLGRPLPVVDVVVRDPRHINLGAQHFWIGAKVRLGSATSFRFSRRLLEAPANNRAGEYAHWEVARLWLDLAQDAVPRQNASIYIGDNGFTRMKDIAAQSNVSRATMRRRLQSTEGGFRGARRQALVEAATGMLLAGEDSVEIISAELGYSDVRNFRRFIKTATGLTPQQLRLRSRSMSCGDDQRVVERLRLTSAQFWPA